MDTQRSHSPASASTPALPRPSRHAAWRWATPRRALLGGGALAAVLSLSAVTAGATTPSGGTPPTGGGQHGGPAGGMRPTASGKVTSVSGDVITLSVRTKSTPTVTVDTTASTTYRTMTGSTTASAVKVGDFVSVQGTKASDGTVTAKTVMVGTAPPGKMGAPGGKRPSGQKGAPPSGAGATTP
jgi:hypothetical protein